jgi:hypothetical protein
VTQQVIHARVSLPSADTFEDLASFGLTFEATGSSPTITLSDIDLVLEDFLNNPTGVMAHAICWYMSSGISRVANACTITYYDVTAQLGGLSLGAPIGITPFTLGATDPGPVFPLPSQVAVCIGYRAAYGTDQEHGVAETVPSDARAIREGAPATHAAVSKPRASDRGRFYLGPLQSELLDSTPGEIAPSAYADFDIAANVLLSTQGAGLAGQFNAVVWSRRLARVKQVKFFYVDEAFATIRKREDTTANRVHTWVGTTD